MRSLRPLAVAAVLVLSLGACSDAKQDAADRGTTLAEVPSRADAVEAESVLRNILVNQEQHLTDTGRYADTLQALRAYGFRAGSNSDVTYALCVTAGGAGFVAQARVRSGNGEVFADRFISDQVREPTESSPGGCTPPV